jgi:hypothetical protein
MVQDSSDVLTLRLHTLWVYFQIFTVSGICWDDTLYRYALNIHNNGISLYHNLEILPLAFLLNTQNQILVDSFLQCKCREAAVWILTAGHYRHLPPRCHPVHLTRFFRKFHKPWNSLTTGKAGNAVQH